MGSASSMSSSKSLIGCCCFSALCSRSKRRWLFIKSPALNLCIDSCALLIDLSEMHRLSLRSLPYPAPASGESGCVDSASMSCSRRSSSLENKPAIVWKARVGREDSSSTFLAGVQCRANAIRRPDFFSERQDPLQTNTSSPPSVPPIPGGAVSTLKLPHTPPFLAETIMRSA